MDMFVVVVPTLAFQPINSARYVKHEERRVCTLMIVSTQDSRSGDGSARQLS